MSWLEPNDRQTMPDAFLLDAIWQAVVVRPIAEIHPVVQQYLDELRGIYMDDEVAYASFELGNSSGFDWFASRNRWQELDFFRRFLLHPTVSATLPDVIDGIRFDDPLRIDRVSSVTLDGELALTLIAGGAYTRTMRTPREAKTLGGAVCDALFGDRFLDISVYTCADPWSAWFHSSGMSNTCFIIDRRFQKVSILASTNTS